jgi:hypothetical protein
MKRNLNHHNLHHLAQSVSPEFELIPSVHLPHSNQLNSDFDKPTVPLLPPLRNTHPLSFMIRSFLFAVKYKISVLSFRLWVFTEQYSYLEMVDSYLHPISPGTLVMKIAALIDEYQNTQECTIPQLIVDVAKQLALATSLFKRFHLLNHHTEPFYHQKSQISIIPPSHQQLPRFLIIIIEIARSMTFQYLTVFQESPLFSRHIIQLLILIVAFVDFAIFI